MSTSPTASCVVIGNEILSGKVRDSNAHHLALWLRQRGVDLQRIQVIPDVIATIGAVVAEESARSDIVFTSGGVGPTHDDLTYAGVAAAFELPVGVNATLLGHMENFYGGPVSEVRQRMATLPDPCELLTVDGLWVPVVKVRNVHVLPGVPLLFEKMLAALGPHVHGTPVTLHSIYTMQSEEMLAPLLESVLVEFAGIEIGSYPRMDKGADHRVRVTLESRDAGLCLNAARALLGKLDPGQVVRIEGFSG